MKFDDVDDSLLSLWVMETAAALERAASGKLFRDAVAIMGTTAAMLQAILDKDRDAWGRARGAFDAVEARFRAEGKIER